MKKRKSCTLSQIRSPKDTQSLTRLNSSSKLSSSHISIQNKRQISTKNKTTVRPKTSSSKIGKKETYKSLESLFDLSKPIELEDSNFPFFYPPAEEEKGDTLYENTSISVYSAKDRNEFTANELITSTSQSLQDTSQYLGSDSEVISESSPIALTPVLSEIEEDSSPIKMADNTDADKEIQEKEEETVEVEKPPEPEPPAEPEVVPPPEPVVDQNNVPPAQGGEDKIEEPAATGTSVVDTTSTRVESPVVSAEKMSTSSPKTSPKVSPRASRGENRPPSGKSYVYAPDYPLPLGTGLGILPKCGQNRDSVMSTLPLMEDSVAEEMRKAEERAYCVREEIQALKKILDNLISKEELSEEDTLTLRDTQTTVMQKIGELNEITRKLQRTIGLCDPSTQTFARMFEMLPYPHIGTCGPKIKRKGPCCDPFKSQAGDCGEDTQKPETCTERFAFPQIDYPEDKLPRVIVCGTTAENFPKIVVADSRPKGCGNKCLQNLTGKLSESLCMQERLARENADLEGGKFQLEREILQKDNAVENLQRKICGLQAEMRIVVKENNELSKKLTCLAQQNNLSPSPRSCSPCSDFGASKSSPAGNSRNSPCASPKKNDLSCKCCPKSEKLCPETKVDCSVPPPPRKTCGNEALRRLCGGGSRGREDGNNLGQDMYYSNCGSACQKTPPPSRKSQRISGGGGCGKKVCPSEIDNRLDSYGNNTKYIGDQLSCIENEVRALQNELVCVQQERQQLEQQRKQLECGGSCSACNPCGPQPKAKIQEMPCGPCNESSSEASSSVQQLCALREQYARLQDDYKNKLCETSRLRSEIEGYKRDTREAKEERERVEIKLVDAQERLRICENEKNCLMGCKEQLIDQEQALLVAKQRFRESQEELEELRTMIRDQASQLDDYRNKYLLAQQQVEEQRRQMDLMEMDNARMNENVTLEIGRVKNQFQEKLAELAPLPDILKQTQMKLAETTQMRLMAEHNCKELSRELLGAKEKIDTMNAQINDLQREISNLQDDKGDNNYKIDELEKKNGELRNENERLKTVLTRLEELQNQTQKCLDEKQHEIVQLNAMLEQVREDSARQVARTKERTEAIKRSMQAQISDFEIQLASCRAAAKTAQKERDEIRQKMQGQIVNLNESLQQAQGRIRSLQGHVDYLKVSYSNVFSSPVDGRHQDCPSAVIECSPSATGQGYDSCDCNY